MDIIKDHADHVGKLIRVSGCQIGDRVQQDLDWRDFPNGLWVRVGDSFDPQLDVSYNHGIIDTYWDAEALPGQLREGEYVSWIDGPSYFPDGRQTTETWMEVRGE